MSEPEATQDVSAGEPDEIVAPEDGSVPEEALASGAAVPELTVAIDVDTLAAPGDTTVFRVMNVESVVFDLGDPSPQAHLMESEAPYRHVSIPIALPEAQALYAAMNNLTGRRPSTHELASAILRQLQGDIIAVRVVRHELGVFYAELDVMTPRGREQFDCRTSDAFILALRQAVPAPILFADEVLEAFYL